MKKRIVIGIFTTMLLGMGCPGSNVGPAMIQHPATGVFDGENADHSVVGRLYNGEIPIADIQNAKGELHIAYGHTSHGSQLISGMNGLQAFAASGALDGINQYSTVPDLFNWSTDASSGLHLFEGDGYGNGAMDHDAGYNNADWNVPGSGEYHASNWYLETRQFLDDPANHMFNVVIWSWCGQLGWMSEEAVQDYLTKMDTLRADYPNVVFVYMTGHLDGTGVGGTLNRNNNLIRQHCQTNSLWLYDFADIESYDPDGVSQINRSPNDGGFWDSDGDGVIEGYTTDVNGNQILGDDRNWAVEWQNAHALGSAWYDCGAAHSESVIGNLKAYAAWWLWASIARNVDWE